MKELEFAITQSAFTSIRDGLNEELELARIALASLEEEPVAYIFKHPAGKLFWALTDESNKGQSDVIPVYAAPLASERERIRREHAEWSDATFGDVGPIGPLKHLSKEALEAAADPSDPLEWADMQFLLWDAQRRMGISDEFITRAMIEKLAINKARQWPEPKDGEPRLHIKEQSVPVVPDEMATSDDMNLRAAMLQGAEAVSNRDELPLDYLQGHKDGLEWAAQLAEANHPQTGDWLYDDPIELAREIRKGPDMPTVQAGNSPATPDGWISCSERMPDNDESKPIAIFTGKCLGQGMFVATYDDDGFFDYWEGMEIIGVTHWMPLPEPPQK
ncbi:DUF550 domain-containing protein [Salmonella enterica subsp. salamae]|nr:DUF550 domain-containing protein [Salmonella enterica]ECD9301624.1 DUF550 domain-containing protein [Salmonella enterica subsp. salamae]ECD9460059.1 DUF550 domain-containing protein [Salmonella enterica subsp. salamae]ECE5349649.1 DUF550 domain-containing protein [Salmonella enterica]ECI3978666.1 DUF550 domain-containing protein [Salmonella enterica subsp. salamae]